MPSKILHLESPHICHLADGFASWYCGESQCESLNTSRSRVQVSRAAQHHYLSVAILIEIKILSSISSIRTARKSITLTGQRCEQMPLTLTYERATQEMML